MIDSCLDLAMLYHVDPWSIMQRPAREVEEVYDLTMKRVELLRNRKE